MQTEATLPYSRADLIARIEAGETFEYMPFYGHQPSKDGSVAKSCFSQWFPADFEIDGIKYTTAEQFMMAEKARLFKDDDMLAQILAAPDPSTAKKLGRQVSNFVDEVWKKSCFDIVVRVNQAKFSQNNGFKQFILTTGHKILVEASPRDRIWGVGMGASNPAIEDPTNWRGSNLLGFALIKVRTQLKSEQ